MELDRPAKVVNLDKSPLMILSTARSQGAFPQILNSKKFFALLVCLGVILFLLSPFLATIVVASLIYFAWVDANARFKKLNRSKKKIVITSLLVGSSFIGYLFYSSIVTLVSLQSSLGQNLDVLFGSKSKKIIQNFLLSVKNLINDLVPAAKVSTDTLFNKFGEIGNNIVTSTAAIAVGFFSSIPDLLLQVAAFVATIWILSNIRSNKPTFLKKFLSKYRDEQSFIKGLVLESSYITIFNTMVVGLLQALTITVGAIILNLDFWPLIFISTFFCSLFPVVGTIPVSILTLVYLWTNQSTSAALIFLIFAVAASLIDNLVRPYLLTSNNNESFGPVVAFFSVLGGVYVMGFSGLFIAPFLLIIAEKIFFSFVKKNEKILNPQLVHEDIY